VLHGVVVVIEVTGRRQSKHGVSKSDWYAFGM
jgi:hypothetical protein